MKTRYHYILILLLSLVACKEDKNYFQVILTGIVTNIDSTGATFNAKLINTTEAKISEYGFTWGLSDKISVADSKITFTDPLREGVFNFRIYKELYPDSIYYVKAFVVKDAAIIYGAAVSFRSSGSNPPLISDFEPKSAYAGDTISISGDNFSSTNSNNRVYLTNKKLTTVYSSEKLVKVVIPYDINSFNSILSLEVSGVRVNSNESVEIKETWTKTDEHTRFSYSITGFFIGGILYLRYTDGYRGFFAYNVKTKTLESKTDYSNYSESMMFSVNDKGYLFYYTQREHFLEYVQVAGTWIKRAIFPGTLREDGVTFSIGDNAYFGLGYGEKLLNDFWKYDSKNNTWSRIADFPGQGRIRAVGFSYNNRGYVGLGRPMILDLPAHKDIWEYDPSTNVWKKVADYPGISQNWGGNAITLKNKLFIGLKDFWEYDFLLKKWKRIGDFQGGGSSIPFITNDTVYIGSMMPKDRFTMWKLNKYD